MTPTDELKEAVDKILSDKNVGFEECLELLAFLNTLSANVTKQLSDHFKATEKTHDTDHA
jgi:hypothetical protein